jgi:hypothetical protein
VGKASGFGQAGLRCQHAVLDLGRCSDIRADLGRRCPHLLHYAHALFIGLRRPSQTHLESILGSKPARCPSETTTALGANSGSSHLAPYTSLISRSRNFCGYFLSAGLTLSFRRIRASTKPGAIQASFLRSSRTRGLSGSFGDVRSVLGVEEND